MTGYLGRMVAASAAREPRLRPFAGSIYGEGRQNWPARQAARRDADPAADLEQNLVVEANVEAREANDGTRAPLATQRRASDAQNPATPVDEFVPLYPQRRDNRFPTGSPASSRISSSLEQDLTVSQATPAGLPHTGRSPARRTAPDPQTDEAAPRLHPLDLTVTRAPSAARAAAIAPTAVRPTDRDGATSRLARTGENASQEAGQTSALAPSRLPVHAVQQRNAASGTHEFSRSSAAEEQSVEIHIGRVEVLAVAPPAPRAPAASKSRTTSLADYLARRNGHTR
jgi:hypothetical protein